MKLLELPGALGAAAARLWGLTRPHRIPALAGLAIAAGAFFLHQRMAFRENAEIYRTVGATALRLRSEFAEQLLVRKQAVGKLAARWEREARPDRDAWMLDASRLAAADLQLRGVGWLEPSLDVRWAGPFGVRLSGEILDPADDDLRRTALEATRIRAEPTLLPSVLLSSGRRQVLVCAPMLAGGEPAGFVVGAMRTRDLLDALAGPETARGYAVAVFEGPYQLWGPVWAESGIEAALANDAELSVDDLSLRVLVWPSDELAAAMRSPVKDAVLGFGVALAFLFAVAVHQLQGWRARALAAEAALRAAAGEGPQAGAGEPSGERGAEPAAGAGQAAVMDSAPAAEESRTPGG